MKKFSVLVALAMLIGFGTVTTMTYANEPAAPTEKDKEKNRLGQRRRKARKKDEKKDDGR